MATVITTVVFKASGFTFDKQSFFAETSDYYKGMKFSNDIVPIGLFGTTYGYVTGLTITFNGTAPYAGISFESPPPSTSPFSVGQNGIEGFFMPFNHGTPLPLYDIKLKSGDTINPYIIVNGDPNNTTDSLYVLLSVGVKYNADPDSVNSITVTYECNPVVPLYSVYTGLHVYSPYDSINTPKLHTYLYSKIDPLLWDVGTTVWSSPWFDYIALQYYYGYDVNNKVYKVGGPIDRSYGTKKIITTKMSLWRKIWGKKAKVKVKIEGPKSYYHSSESSPDDNDTIDACVDVLYSRASMITQVINNSANPIPQPTKYEYWMGYDSITKQLSNDNFFAKWVFNQNKFYPITGYQHMVIRLAEGIFKSTDWMAGINGDTNWTELTGNMGYKWMLLAATGIPVTYSVLYAVVNTSVGFEFIPDLFYGLNSPAFSAMVKIGTSLIPTFWLITLPLLILGLAWALFSEKTKTFIESCKIFLGEYTTTPYIEIGSVLSRLKDMSQKNLGYYCDGAYFYTQPTTSGVTIKELSSTNALVNENPIQQQFKESVLCDDPTLVTLFYKLMFLPYLSGIPADYGASTIYYSVEIIRIIPLTDCAELLTTPSTQTFILPAGYVTSFISQSDADTRASSVADDISDLVAGSYNYGDVLSEANLGVIDSYFTHEIRVETTPTICTIFYNNTDQLGPIVGRKVYFDMEGQYEVINGYYGTDNNTYFRIFYKVVNSVITNIYTMVASNSTTVQGLGGVEDILPVLTNNLTYSSNWYIQSPSQSNIGDIINNILENRCFDLNSLYGESYIVRGYYDPVNNHFLLYNDNYSNYATSEAPTDWYLPIIEWPNEVLFQYSLTLSIAIDIEEICLPQTEYVNALYGFYVIGSSSGNITPLFNEVNLTISVYVGAVLKHTYTVITNASGKTYVPYGGYVLDTEDVTSIVINSINGSNPIGNISYTIGSFINCTNTPPLDPFATGLEACWNFEEASTPLLDSTINHNDLSQTTDVTFHQPGKVGTYCINLPLATSVASTITSDTLELQAFSISAWVNCVGTVPNHHTRTIFSKVSKNGIYDSGGYDIAVNGAYGGVLFHIFNSNGSEANSTHDTTPVNDGNWHHIVATYSSTDRNIKIYHNTVLETDQIMPVNLSYISYGSTYVPATVGNASHGIYSYPLIGSVDAVAVWNRVLTPYEVQVLYNDGNGVTCP
jgi:hypothetical protein